VVARKIHSSGVIFLLYGGAADRFDIMLPIENNG
jgi:hypothetical protein